MKVYVITAGCHSDYHICAVKESYDEAVGYIESAVRSGEDWVGHYTIEIYDTKADKVSESMKWFRVAIKDGVFTAHQLTESDFSGRGEGKYYSVGIEQKYCANSNTLNLCRTFVINYFYIDVITTDEAHALKIAQDRWAKFKAEKSGIV